jgi:L-aminopeptidase/D-esterase-like protein
VIPPPGSRGAVEVLGGGTGTREVEPLRLLANAEGPNAVLLTGGSAFGLAATDGVVRWLEERALGRPTLAGVVPLVPTAVIFDLHAGGERPGPQQGYEACERAASGDPERGSIGAGAGAAVGKVLGRQHATNSGVGYAAGRTADGITVAAVAVANSVGDVIDRDGSVLGGPHDDKGQLLRSVELFAGLKAGATWPITPGESTTLVCICTDAPLDKRDCGIVARMAAAGVARAVDPVFSPMDGDVIFCLAAGSGAMPAPGFERSILLSGLGAVAASTVADAIRDAVRQAVRP